jgi:hypothetical protein
MLLIPHTLVGIAIAAVVDQPFLALPLAFFSHFILDAIPHWDPLIKGIRSSKFSGVRGKVLFLIAIDFLIALDLGLFFVWRALPDISLAAKIFFAAFLANLPDGLMTPFIFFGKRWGWLEAYRQFHGRIQTKLTLPWGLLPQAAVAAIGLAIVLL